MLFVIAITAIGYTDEPLLPPRPSGPVADFAGLLDKNTKLRINSLARSLWVNAKFGLIVATVPSIDDLSLEAYAGALYRTWGAGLQKEPEDALVLLSVNPPGVHIEVGRDAESYLNEMVTGNIIENKGLPYFRKGEYNTGLINIAHALAKVVADEKRIALTGDSSSVTPFFKTLTGKSYKYRLEIVSYFAGFIVVALLATVLLSKRKKFINGSYHYLRHRFGGSLFYRPFGGWLSGKKGTGRN